MLALAFRRARRRGARRCRGGATGSWCRNPCRACGYHARAPGCPGTGCRRSASPARSPSEPRTGAGRCAVRGRGPCRGLGRRLGREGGRPLVPGGLQACVLRAAPAARASGLFPAADRGRAARAEDLAARASAPEAWAVPLRRVRPARAPPRVGRPLPARPLPALPPEVEREPPPAGLFAPSRPCSPAVSAPVEVPVPTCAFAFRAILLLRAMMPGAPTRAPPGRPDAISRDSGSCG